MNDREFIELLNLYVDREISPEDAARLEAEVVGDAGRRRVYDQYCRMQKACSMLSARPAETAADGTESRVLEFPAPRAWRFGSTAAGIAAAACIIAIFGLRERGALETHDAPRVAVAPGAPVHGAADLSLDSDPMKPVFIARVPSVQGARSVPGGMFAMVDDPQEPAPLNWIGGIHMAPVFSGANPEFLLAPKADLKAAILDGPQSGRYPPDAAEMTAFRFQR